MRYLKKFPLFGKETKGDSFFTKLTVNVFLVVDKLKLVNVFAKIVLQREIRSSTKMKILYIAHEGHMGGATKSLLTLAELIEKQKA